MKKLALFNLYALYCFDVAAIVMVIIIFTPLLTQSSSQLVSTTLSNRHFILGLLLAAYPITQFLGAPILGDFSDHFGRRNVLFISSALTAFSFLISALSIQYHSLLWLFISRFLGGFFAGNASLAQATVSDLIPTQKKASYMALFTVVGGMAWIIGPFVGGVLSSSKIVHWFNFSTPFWFLALIFLAFSAIALITLDQTKSKTKKSRLTFVQTFKNLASIFKHSLLVPPFLTSAFSIFAWMIIQTFTASYLMDHYGYTLERINYLYAYNSCFWLMGGLSALFWFKKHPASKLNFFCMFGLSLFIVAYAFSPNAYAPYYLLGPANILMSFSMSAYMALFSHLASSDIRGKIFGSYVASLALASALAPTLAGLLTRYSINLPFYLSSLVMLLSALAYLLWLIKKNKILKEHKV